MTTNAGQIIASIHDAIAQLVMKQILMESDVVRFHFTLDRDSRNNSN